MKSSDSGGSSPKDQAASVSGLLEKQIAAPLVRVQTALAKETVLWKRGVLVMPQVQLLNQLPVQHGSAAYGGTMCRGGVGGGGGAAGPNAYLSPCIRRLQKYQTKAWQVQRWGGDGVVEGGKLGGEGGGGLVLMWCRCLA